MRKIFIPKLWLPDAIILEKCIAFGIPDLFYNEQLVKFKTRFIFEGESKNDMLLKFIIKQWRAKKNRSEAQKARHRKPAATAQFIPKGFIKSDSKTAKLHLLAINKILKDQ